MRKNPIPPSAQLWIANRLRRQPTPPDDRWAEAKSLTAQWPKPSQLWKRPSADQSAPAIGPAKIQRVCRSCPDLQATTLANPSKASCGAIYRLSHRLALVAFT